ncbi:hypothetical protein GYMLUDRAFT_247396 [Collybiopsis luxurians FD-317 M1]|uniref:Uncharacterized protein n=1 Tax=Collybiopsis luxurians FD-317 M1 TaxID=944289 RepID=A0A0D0CNJ5_9AGAR|nr:hypothetical protein GYMLUDRAFT_247396 [Collybiopsis luxurians FD-317 M1]
MTSSDLWLQTNIGFDEGVSTATLLSDELQKDLQTKFLWHFVLIYLTVHGTTYEEEFIRLAVVIYAAHWLEDTTYGIKPLCQRTCLSKRLVPPEEVDTSGWDLDSMPELYDGVDRERSIERNKLIRATLYTFYRAQYSDSETRQMWAVLTKSVHNFLIKAVMQASSNIKSYVSEPLSDSRLSDPGLTFLNDDRSVFTYTFADPNAAEQVGEEVSEFHQPSQPPITVGDMLSSLFAGNYIHFLRFYKNGRRRFLGFYMKLFITKAWKMWSMLKDVSVER